jgi:LysR family transcriptional regulator, nitrogen assimilation regulatory protein
MDLRQLRYFLGIIQAGSLSRAAGQLHVAQSALSHHLGALETELGRDLVTRGPSGVRLTEAGSVLYRHAEAILRHVEFAKEDVKSALNIPSGRVSIGFPTVLAGILGCALLRRIRNTYPQILLHVSDANGWVMRERLLNGALDIAVLFADRSERGLVAEPLLVEELLYFTADADPSPIRIADVARRPLLVSGPKGSSRCVAEEAFKKHGLTVVPSDEIDALGTLRSAVASGIGNSILPWSALYDGERRTALNYRRIADAKLVRTVSLCFSEVVERTPAIEATAETLKSLVRELVDSGSWQGVSLIESSREPAHALVPQKVRRTPIPRSPRRRVSALRA